MSLQIITSLSFSHPSLQILLNRSLIKSITLTRCYSINYFSVIEGFNGNQVDFHSENNFFCYQYNMKALFSSSIY